jgi:hypothetical protein
MFWDSIIFYKLEKCLLVDIDDWQFGTYLPIIFIVPIGTARTWWRVILEGCMQKYCSKTPHAHCPHHIQVTSTWYFNHFSRKDRIDSFTYHGWDIYINTGTILVSFITSPRSPPFPALSCPFLPHYSSNKCHLGHASINAVQPFLLSALPLTSSFSSPFIPHCPSPLHPSSSDTSSHR